MEPAARALKGIVAPRSAASGASAPRPVIDFMTIERERDFVGRTQHPQRYDGVPDPVAPSRELDDAADERAVAESLFDLVLGAWAHLLADSLWNTRVNEFLEAHGGKPSNEFRIKKQADFEAFGHTLAIGSVPRPTRRLLATARAFPQYAIEEKMALLAVGVMHEIARGNGGVPAHGSYQLLDEEFFTDTFAETVSAVDGIAADRLPICI